jgi:hypothetical protein
MQLAKRLDNGNSNSCTHVLVSCFVEPDVHCLFLPCPVKLLPITPEQRRALELLVREPRGVTGHVLVIAHGLEMKMLAGLVQEGLAAAVVGEPVKDGGEAIEVVRFWITAAGRRAIEKRPTTTL